MRRNLGPIIFLALTVLTFAGGVGGFYLGWTGLSKAKASLAKVRKDIRPESAVERDLKASEAKLAESQGKLEHLETSVSQREYVPTLLAELEQLGGANGLKITGVRPKEEPKKAAKTDDKKEKPGKKTGYEELIVEVKGSGSFGAVYAFVVSLEKFPKIVAIRSMDLAPRRGGREDEADALEMTLELRAFLFPPEKTNPSKDPEKAADGQTAENRASHEVG